MKNKFVLRLIVPPAVIFMLIILLIINLSTKNSSPPMQSGWVLQTNLQSQLRGRTVNDMTFIDSVTGFAVTNALSQTDTCFIFKTTNGGDNWFVNYWTNEEFANAFYKIKFVTDSIGFVCGGGGIALICKTTDRGNTWIKTNYTSTLSFKGMSCLNKDTLFVVSDETMTGGVFRSLNGGQNWQHLTSGEPNNIYMYNSRIGFYSKMGLYKTTDGGFNWTQINNKGFVDIKFFDSLMGYKGYADSNGFGRVQKTTNGGYNWVVQPIPVYPGEIVWNDLTKIFFKSIDTIWAVGSYVEFQNPIRRRGLIYKTTNGGLNWGYQLPDTHAVQISRYDLICFVGNKYGWIYNGHYLNGKGLGVYTISGGDTTIYANIKEQTHKITTDFILYQNYPNPFNSMTNINFQCTMKSYLKIKIFDISGREITTLMDEKKSPGNYEVRFNGENLSSGIYFYSLYADGEKVGTKRMIVVK